MNSSPTRLRLDYLDGLRALAALMVLFNHSWRMAWPRMPGERIGALPADPWLLLVTGWARYGHFAVTVFIVISGFCLMLPVLRHGGKLPFSAREFFQRRARRILPTYYAALGVSLLLIWLLIGQETGTQWDAQLPVSKSGILSRLLLLQDVWRPYQINNPFWSIAVEWRIYFLFPLLVWAFRRFGAGRTTLVALVASAALLQVSLLEKASIHYAGIFVLGMLGAVYAHRADERLASRLGMAAVVPAALLIGICVSQPFRWAEGRFHELDYLVGLATAAGLAYLGARESHPMKTGLSWRPLVFIGGFSYSIYLMHMPLLQLVWQYGLAPLGLSRAANLGLLVTVGWAAVLLLAYGFYLAFERPFLNSRSPRPVTAPEAAPAPTS